ncbi:APH-domain-containing protein [Cucurbitaria berberidis CBS 394.84]|uniref:APH-domain-containing protein n=1 Tax=Cucurbitaria berberidis CBS 394.84 TaxID=1168544 RepID=A0A9P4G6N2_9PLEO|nr:APH-domain-containing protein [Cucurbitaria berberidis CBS 394.84]KAF1840000.1 APH-domain-containing protein [Cucurbitaria berberidis CBS 394.84]
MSGTTEQKARHDLDDDKLGKYLQQEIPDLKLPVQSTKIGYGQSNPTYFVDDAGNTRYILRKKPSGTIISPVAHQVDREYKVLKALGSVEGFPVPKVYCLCMDASIIGTIFYVMEFVKGRIITDPNLSTLSPTERRSAWFSVVSTLAWLHSIDPDAIGLSDFGKKTGFYTRHCNTFSRIEAQQAKVKDIATGKELGRAHPNFDEIVEHIRKNVPTDRTSIIHGDYKFDNMILHPTEPRVIAILDWELSTIGHPLMDAVYVVGPYWNRVGKSGISGGPKMAARDDQGGEVYEPENQAENGMPSMDELLDEYAKITGWDPRKDQWEIAKVFHLMRGSTISHGIQARTISGQASSEFSHVYFESTKRGLNGALEMVRSMKEKEPTRSMI